MPTLIFNERTYGLRSDGYYRHSKKVDGRVTHSHLHRDVWIHHHGPIPVGYDVHHKDGDRSNNHIDNLECLPKAEHMRRHMQEWHAANPDASKDGVLRMRAGSAAWHRSPEGRAWHSEKNRKMWQEKKCLR